MLIYIVKITKKKLCFENHKDDFEWVWYSRIENAISCQIV